MAEVASAFVALMPSAKGFGRASERQIAPQMNSVAKKTGSRFGQVFASAARSPLKSIGLAVVGLFAVQKVKQFFQGAIAEAREAQKVSAITAAVIQSTGGAANISAGQVGSLAESISRLTGIDDEAIQSGANLLLTFKNLRNEAGAGNNIFDQTTRLMTDMSVAMGTDAKSSAIQLGKALNDPVKGISALTRVGVTFTEGQKAQIEALVASGNTLKAQKLILAELRSEFGGTAAAAATAGDRFKVAYANFQESVGTALLPLLDRLLLKGIKVIGFLENDVPRAFVAFTAAITPAVNVVRGFVEEHLPAFKTALAALGGAGLTSLISLMGGGLVSALGVVVGALLSPIALVGALAGAFLYAYRTSDEFRAKVNELAAFAQTNLVPALVQVGAVIRDDVAPALATFGRWLVGTAYPAVISFWQGIGQKLKPALVALATTIRQDVLPGARALLAELRQHGPALRQVAELVLKFQVACSKLSSSILGEMLPPLIRVAGFLLGKYFSALATVIDQTAKWITVLGRIGGALVEAGQAVTKFVGVIQSKVAIMVGIGRDLVMGLINGIKSMAGSLVSAAKSVVEGAINAAKSALKIGSPSKVFHQIGQWTIEGFENGIKAAGPKMLKTMESTLDKVIDQTTTMRDRIKSNLDGVLSDFTSLKNSIASTFTGDLFGVSAIASSLTETTFTAAQTVGQAFVSNLMDKKGQLTALLAAFKTLKGWGIPAQFLSQLFASGNGGLILELAGGSQAGAESAVSLFGDVQSLSSQLGGQVARNQYGPQIKRLEDKLDRANKHLKHLDTLARDLGRALNNASANSQRGPK